VKYSATNDQEQGETELSLLLSDGYTEPSSVRERERVDVERGKRSRGEVRPSEHALYLARQACRTVQIGACGESSLMLSV